MDVLYALPVSGESFLLNRNRKTILVDAGESAANLERVLYEKLKIRKIDVAVCTHSDSDHAKGFEGLFQRVRVGELWLPATWAYGILGISRDYSGMLDKITREIVRFLSEDIQDIYDDKDFYDGFEDKVNSRYSKVFGSSTESFVLGEEVSIEQYEYLDCEWDKRFLDDRKSFEYAHMRKLDKKINWFSEGKKSIAKSLVKVAFRIVRIYFEAVRSGVRVRWFDYRSYMEKGSASGGEDNYLLPINSIELKKIPSYSFRDVMFALSLNNEECLAFFSPADKGVLDLGVIFCGDSPLGVGPGYKNIAIDSSLIGGHVCIASAPHHGSESNKAAYTHLASSTSILMYLRSGGMYYHPGNFFRSIPACMRACVSCPHNGYKKELASVQLSFVFPFPIVVRSHHCTC